MIAIAFLTWIANQAIKLILFFITEGKWDLNRFFGAGGMPSTHSALSVSVAVSIGYIEGWDSALFALASVFAIVVMADAAGVRRATGEQAKALNKLMLIFFKENRLKNGRMKEFIGHTPFEVIVGAIIGLLIATLFSVYFS
ncbi:MAG: divergent PAP2 family protein [Atribacterota bacterium]|nr:divergent PAP2 family protein [Atribacterota bacterium]MDD4896733.1 divergent PAP2 family protein [Atribacterota bacterium]MDD5637721.1 divergent PAP2 family protein [Atribacterota bacterium]